MKKKNVPGTNEMLKKEGGEHNNALIILKNRLFVIKLFLQDGFESYHLFLFYKFN